MIQNKFCFLVNLFFVSSTFAYTEQVFSGIKKINISDDVSINIKSTFDKSCNKEIDVCLPSNELFILDHGYRYDYSALVKYWNEETFVYFVYLQDKEYFKDLDGDGNYEIALYPMNAGNNPITDAYIYTLKDNKLIFFGMGRFHYERGPYVKNIIQGKWIEPLI